MRKVNELLRLDGRVAVVTGGAGHLGLAFGEALVEQGAHVVVVDRDANLCDQRARSLTEHGGTRCLGLAVDLAEPDCAPEIVQRTLNEFERLDILVNNAAFTGMSGLEGYAVPFPKQTLQAWRMAIEVNLTAAFALIQEASESLGRSGRGSVVNIGSTYGLVGPNLNLYTGTEMGNPAAYAGSKGGLIQLTRYLATVLAPSCRVNAISPGGIERGQPQVFQDRYATLTPLGRMGSEEDFKAALVFLASDASAYVTGHNLVVDGGWTAW